MKMTWAASGGRGAYFEVSQNGDFWTTLSVSGGNECHLFDLQAIPPFEGKTCIG
jgi:hypothetical protein